MSTDVTLTAVNEMMTALGLRTVTTYASGTALEASTFLARWSTKIQSKGWHCNTEGTSRRYGDTGIELAPHDTTLVYTGSITGTFLAGETVTESTSGATGRFHTVNTTTKVFYLTTLTGTFTGVSETLTGATSGATATESTAAATTSIASGYIYVDYDILRADPTDDSYPDVTLRGGRFWDKESSTFLFTDSLKVVQVRELSFADLPDTLRELISIHALIDFCAKIKVPVPEDAAKRLTAAQMDAAREEQDRADINLADSEYFRNIGGRRGTVAPWR